MTALLVALACIAVAIVAARLVFALPQADRTGLSRAIPVSQQTALGRVAADHGEASAILSLDGGREAFAARALLIRAAERSIDVQYYIWQNDITGMLLLRELRDAADRGVRVRLLLDDNGIAGLDRELAGLLGHDDVELRLWNPFVLRRPKILNYAFDFFRLNRRMHNKSLTVDGAVTIVGGRNVGDEYFAARSTGDFFDLDVMAVGAIVPKVAAQFDAYWTSGSVHDGEAILGAGDRAHLDAAIAASEREPRSTQYRDAIAAMQFVADFVDGDLELETVDISLVADDPRKGAGGVEGRALLVGQLDALLGRPTRDVDLVSAYFVPGTRGTQALADMAGRGVEVSILTNSLAATDVAAVHAGYAKYRRALLAAGTRLFELKREQTRPVKQANPGDDLERDDFGPGGSSAASLHAKTFGIDGERVFIGSFNMDPRSVYLNTEMGFLIESEPLARALSDRLETALRFSAYRVELTDDGHLVWIETLADGSTVTHSDEPDASWARRATVAVVRRLPVEWLL